MNEWLYLYLVVFLNIYTLIPFDSCLMSGSSYMESCYFFAWETISSLILLTEIQFDLWSDIILYINFYLLLLPNQKLLLTYLPYLFLLLELCMSVSLLILS